MKKQLSKLDTKDAGILRGVKKRFNNFLLKMTLYLLQIKQTIEKKIIGTNTIVLKPYNLLSLASESTIFMYKLRVSSELSNKVTGTVQEYDKLKKSN